MPKRPAPCSNSLPTSVLYSLFSFFLFRSKIEPRNLLFSRKNYTQKYASTNIWPESYTCKVRAPRWSNTNFIGTTNNPNPSICKFSTLESWIRQEMLVSMFTFASLTRRASNTSIIAHADGVAAVANRCSLPLRKCE